MSSNTTSIVYGNDVTYSNGTYTLTNTITSSDWSSLYADGLKNNHYTCFSTGTTCSEVAYIYETSSSTAYYLSLTGGVDIEKALANMLGADDNNTANYNKTSSTIKGNNTTSGTLDYWYYTNIEQKGYSNYIEDTVWCNDRNIHSLGGFNPDGGLTNVEGEDDGMSSLLVFSGFGSIFDYMMGTTTTISPKLTCNRNIDKFTVNESNGNGDLDYPVGLLTADEIMLAGADVQGSSNKSYYLYSGDYYWAGSPIDFDGLAGETFVYSDGGLNDFYVRNSIGVRPSVSLKPGFSLTGDGDGTVTNPYVVE